MILRSGIELGAAFVLGAESQRVESGYITISSRSIHEPLTNNMDGEWGAMVPLSTFSDTGSSVIGFNVILYLDHIQEISQPCCPTGRPLTRLAANWEEGRKGLEGANTESAPRLPMARIFFYWLYRK